MPAPDPSDQADRERIPENLVEAGVYATLGEGFDHGLVVLAMGQSYWLIPADALVVTQFGHMVGCELASQRGATSAPPTPEKAKCVTTDASHCRLMVEPQALAAVREQLAYFDRESLGWPPQPAVEHLRARRSTPFLPLLWALLVAAAFCGQGEWPGVLEDAGALDTRAVFDQGEWWRLGTALFLHADLGHLFANAISGIFVIYAVLAVIGQLRGCLLLTLASLAGNLAAAAINYPGPYRSLGASTAVFAGLGLLTGRAMRAARQTPSPHRWRTVFVPLSAGIVLLGLYGAGGMRTDVAAHVTGFASGLSLGFAAAIFHRNHR